MASIWNVLLNNTMTSFGYCTIAMIHYPNDAMHCLIKLLRWIPLSLSNMKTIIPGKSLKHCFVHRTMLHKLKAMSEPIYHFKGHFLKVSLI